MEGRQVTIFALASSVWRQDLKNFNCTRLIALFGPKGDEDGDWRRLHNEELQSLYRSPNIVRVIKSRRLIWAGHVVRMEEGRRPFGRSRRIWEDNIRMDLEEIGINVGN